MHRFNTVLGRRSLIASCMVAGWIASAAPAGDLYFADVFVPEISDGSIKFLPSDGTNPQTLLTTGGGLRAVDVDAKNEKMYWVDVNNQTLSRADLDGSNPENLLIGGDIVFPSAIDVVPELGKVYWGDQITGFIWSADLNGDNPVIVTSTAFHRGVAVDPVNNKIYWSTSISAWRGDIWRANLDGSDAEIVVTTLDPEFKPSTIALDVVNGKMYWNDYVLDVIMRSDLDGSNQQTLFVVGANHNPRGVALDLAEKKLYWGQDIDFDGTGGMIMRSNLNGSNVEVVEEGLGLVNYLSMISGPVTPACTADIAPFGGDDQVGVDDLLAVISQWGPCLVSPCAADVTEDFTVNVDDLLTIISSWGPCPQP